LTSDPNKTLALGTSAAPTSDAKRPTRVADVMTRKLLTVAGAPVQDDQWQLIGVLTRTGIEAVERVAPASTSTTDLLKLMLDEAVEL
jgi:predicted transcriptional regulator